VSCPKDVQRDRVLARPSMTEAQFELILSKQLPDANKRMMADHVIETASLDATREAVQKLIINLREQHG
jgi:dephospho-CoA kinase